MTILAFDSETTGLDIRHGASPFFITTCDGKGNQAYWEWYVNPRTREVRVPKRDVGDVRDLLYSADELVTQNGKFDVTALAAIGITDFPWHKLHDTLIAGHLLASNLPHNLTSMALQYLGIDIEPLEKAMEEACQKARRIARSKHKDFRIAKKGLPEMPSAKEKCWKADTWLPRVMAGVLGYEEDHLWWTVTRDYANADSATTLAVWNAQRKQIEARNLWAIYKERMKALPIAYRMECHGVTISSTRLNELTEEYREESQRAEQVCTNIATSMGYEISLPKGGNNKALVEFCFAQDGLVLPTVKKSKKTGNPSLDKSVLEVARLTLPQRSKALRFVQGLEAKRQRDTAVSYMEGYRRFWRPLGAFKGHALLNTTSPCDKQDWYVLHPGLNPTGTNTLRWSSANPNETNISKREGFNLRYCFGPAPGREWWSLDAKNIELRIPAYEAEEEAFIALFERPDDPPYFGSNHLLVSHILHESKFNDCHSCTECGKEVWCAASTTERNKCCTCTDPCPMVDGKVFKKRYASTWYQRVKNGNFAVQYGAIDKDDGTGTADRAYGVPGAQAKIKARFMKQEALNQKWIRFAERYGYVETMPDKSVDPTKGYPLLCTRTEWGRILPTVPLNYHVQGTAMWWMHRAMVRVQEQLDKWNRGEETETYRMVLQVHDELVFDFPKSTIHPKDDVGLFRKSNLWKVKVIQKLMELGGVDIGVPTPTSCEYHETSWSEGLSLS